MSEADIESLMNLDPQKFVHKEWLALRYAQDWAFLEGREPNGDYMADYRTCHTKKERAYILKTMRLMRYANYLGNLMYRRAWRPENEGVAVASCSIGEKGTVERI